MPLPPIYLDAGLYNVTPVCPQRGRLGLTLEMPDGTLVRAALRIPDVLDLIGGAACYMKLAAGSQSLMSSDSPSDPGSVPSEGQKV